MSTTKEMAEITEMEKVAAQIEQKAKRFEDLRVNLEVAPEFFENEIWVQFNIKQKSVAYSHSVDEIVKEFGLEYFPASDGFAGAGFWASKKDGSNNTQRMEINFKKVFEGGDE